ncbi:MAG: hypothetical protein WDO74_22650 [Pseudomonadota bacterium]
MKRKVVPVLERVRGSVQFASMGIALALGACGDGQSATGAGAGQAAGGAAASAGIAGAAPGGAGGALLSGTGGIPAHAGALGATAGSSSAGSSNALLGADCESDAECGTGLTCVPSSGTQFGGGAPAHGLCTSLCASDTDCARLEAGAGCFAFDQQAYCLEACTPGDPADLASKCRGRADFVCAPIDAEAYCLPLCRADAECPAGRFCDRARGLCVASKRVGDPVGAACDPTATTSTCREVCLGTSAVGVTPATGVCVEMCSGGLGCMFDDAGTQPGGLCVGQLNDPFGLFDLGYCLPSCDCSSACPIFGNKCRAWTSADADLKTYLGKAGLCYDTTDGSTELTCQ